MLTDRAEYLRKTSYISHQTGQLIYMVKSCEDGLYKAVNQAVLVESYLEAEIEAECYPDGWIYDYAEQERH